MKNHLFNFSKLLNLKRIWNILLVYGSYFISKKTGKNYHFGLPISISIEPTTSCNLRCPECPSGLRSFNRNTGMLTLSLFEQIILQIYKSTSYLTLYFQGEPYLNPDFLRMVSFAVNHKLYTSTSTNAHYLSSENAKKTVESGLNQLIISIDGTTQDIYSQYRVGGSLTKVIEGTKNIIYWKKQLRSKTPHVVFQFLVVKPNEHQLEDVKKLALDLNVDEMRFKTAQVYDYENGNPLIPENDNYSRYKKDALGKWHIKNKLENQCWRMWSSCVITWDGKIVPCCFDKDAKYSMGNLLNTPFKQIWKSEEYEFFRTKILKSRKEIDICSNCSEGTKVWT